MKIKSNGCNKGPWGSSVNYVDVWKTWVTFKKGMHIGYWWEIQKERDHWEDQDVGGWTILKWILER
jgi:hypothetical protein